MKTFKYRWKFGGSEHTGWKDCGDESDLRNRIKEAGGELIEVLEVKEKEQASETVHKTRTKKCPFCSEDIKEEAIKCKHCGTDLLRRNESAHSTDFRSSQAHTDPYRPSRGGNNGLAITSFILGILAVITSAIGLGFLLAIIAVCLGPGGKDSEHGALASWGIGLGWFVIIGSIVVAILWGSIFGLMIFGSR